MPTYYFDASDAAATDPDGVWTNDSNAFDNDVNTSASCSTAGSVSTNFLMAEGTNAPASGFPITSVRAKVWGTAGEFTRVFAAIYTDGLGELLGTATNYDNFAPDTWTWWVDLATPSGGWTWAKVQALEVKIYTDGTEGQTINRVEITVNTPNYAPTIYRSQGFQ